MIMDLTFACENIKREDEKMKEPSVRHDVIVNGLIE